MFLNSINCTNHVLTPKVQIFSEVSHFHFISLCNNLCKVASKILANRLKPFLDKHNSENKGVFLSSCTIQDNIVIAHKNFHFFKNKRNGRDTNYAIKINMNKANNKVEGDFLEVAMC